MTTIHKTNIYTPRHTPRTRTRTRTRQHISKYKKFSFNNLLFNINNKTNNQSKNQSKKQTKNSKKTLFNNNNNKIELLLLFSTLLNYFILLNTNNVSSDIYKDKIVNLLKALRTNNRLISNDTTDLVSLKQVEQALVKLVNDPQFVQIMRTTGIIIEPKLVGQAQASMTASLKQQTKFIEYIKTTRK